jgi:acyl transferase domain-containing protein
LGGTEIAQPVLWAVMVALAEAWQSLGVVPDAVAGHSQGEIAAAAVAGILPLTEAARVVAVRSKALAVLSSREGEAGRGAMAAVAWPPAVAAEQAARHGGRIWVAAVNGPKSVVLAGDRELLAEVIAAADADGVWARWLQVDYASHGPQVDLIRDELQQALADVTPGRGDVPFWSSMTGGPCDAAELDGRYWIANLREQVRFDEVIRSLAAAGHGVFVEVSPHPVLITAIEQTLNEAGQETPVIGGTLRRGDGGADRLLAAAADLFVRGVPVSWPAIFPGRLVRQPSLPTYAFQRQRYWPTLDRAMGRDVDRWRYQTEWHPVAGVQDRAVLTGRWLLVIPSAWAGSELAAACGKALGTADVISLDIDQADLSRPALAGLLRQHDQVAGVVSLLALADTEHTGPAGTLALIQALEDAGTSARLWVLTCGAVLTGEERTATVNVAQAQTWGLGRVAAIEHPQRWGGLVDMPAAFPPRIAGWLSAVLAGGLGEDQVAIRDAGVLARRLVRAPAGHGLAAVRAGAGGRRHSADGRAGRWLAGWLGCAGAGPGLPRRDRRVRCGANGCPPVRGRCGRDRRRLRYSRTSQPYCAVQQACCHGDDGPRRDVRHGSAA